MMQKSVGKREYKTAFAGPASISQKEPPKKLSRQARARINKKRQEEEQSAILPEGRNSAVLIPDIVPPSRSTLFLIQTGASDYVRCETQRAHNYYLVAQYFGEDVSFVPQKSAI
ncbi:hypothetical protein C2G38_2039267 [Gigaspora rosea]|uniref:Uncharacterized protein n=1 Tax=Gigaspora rosea TaxID=44941 RepID=A0A397V0S6_9GLOM|nr:hypothetical protein C2G38_2039267 [Gigaspora rosea]